MRDLNSKAKRVRRSSTGRTSWKCANISAEYNVELSKIDRSLRGLGEVSSARLRRHQDEYFLRKAKLGLLEPKFLLSIRLDLSGRPPAAFNW